MILYHNPRCSKSREALQLLAQHGLAPQIIEYLQTPPDAATLERLLQQLGFSDPRQLMRQKEDVYQEMQLDNPDLSHAALIDAMVTCPRLIERPILVAGERAMIGRPPERLLALL
ncbi:arsenate reductase (glutaredoxin) [Parachitinimonas caeni]|uniref:Arsenate reductase n=1 Tax=Parachitinimonas caeni TaxID=3031301 RepID=A0ABT7DSH0_9NEIS|nr:arsenate reductase (glutaredoxin) [Parachitinimonas caeni]MDK2123016.1 arsenate reductase (glutaredoxin) [Parachitinimonas caeni]